MSVRKPIMAAVAILLNSSLMSFSPISLSSKDFSFAESEKYEADAYFVRASLGDSGLSRLKGLGKAVGKEVQISVGSQTASVLLTSSVLKNLQLGPFPKETADQIVSEINRA